MRHGDTALSVRMLELQVTTFGGNANPAVPFQVSDQFPAVAFHAAIDVYHYTQNMRHPLSVCNSLRIARVSAIGSPRQDTVTIFPMPTWRIISEHRAFASRVE